MAMGEPESLDVFRSLPVGWLFGIAGKLVSTAAFRRMDQHGISPTGFAVLMVLTAGDLKSTEVAGRVGCTPATLTTVAGTLERNGYLERRGHPTDRRVTRLHITDAGRRQALAVRDEMNAWYSEMFDHVSDDEAPVIRRFLLATISRFGQAERGLIRDHTGIDDSGPGPAGRPDNPLDNARAPDAPCHPHHRTQTGEEV